MDRRTCAIKIGFLNNDPAVFFMDEETGKLTGMLAEYIAYAKDCLGNQILKFNIQSYDDYDEMIQYTVAVPKEKEALKQHIAFNYSQWKFVDYDSLNDAADMIIKEKADCFIMGTSQVIKYDNNKDLKSIPLTKTMEACFAVRCGEGNLLSILNKTLKTMPSDMLTSDFF